MHMEVSDVQALVRVLDQKCLEYKVDSKSCVDVFGSFEVTDLVLSLEKEGCKVFSMVERDESLESYYINLMGGESHAYASESKFCETLEGQGVLGSARSAGVLWGAGLYQPVSAGGGRI